MEKKAKINGDCTTQSRVGKQMCERESVFLIGWLSFGESIKLGENIPLPCASKSLEIEATDLFSWSTMAFSIHQMSGPFSRRVFFHRMLLLCLRFQGICHKCCQKSSTFVVQYIKMYVPCKTRLKGNDLPKSHFADLIHWKKLFSSRNTKCFSFSQWSGEKKRNVFFWIDQSSIEN